MAISNHRLLDINNGKVAFRWKDYRHHDQLKTLRLDAHEFIRRFLLHVLPQGFQRLRHYGFLGNRYRERKLAICRQFLGLASLVLPQPGPPADYRDRYAKLTGLSLRDCPVCRQGHMVRVETLPACVRAPPVMGTR